MPLKPAELSRGQRETLRTLLLERAERLRRELREALHASGQAATLGFDNPRELTDDEPVADLEASVQVASAQRDARELEDIALALARLDAGTYGECIDCGEAIAWARLRANPETARCIHCEQAFERNRPGGSSL